MIVLLNKYQRAQHGYICYKLPSSTGFKQPTYNSAVATDYDEEGRGDGKGDQDLHAVVQDQVTKVVVAGDCNNCGGDNEMVDLGLVINV